MENQKTISENSCAAPERRSWLRRLAFKLFGPWHTPSPDLPEWAKDSVTVDTDIRFCFKDRIKLLFGGCLSLRTRTATENEVGFADTESSIAIMPPDWISR